VDGLGIQALVDLEGTTAKGLVAFVDQLVASVVVGQTEVATT
jgi:hypothetical protein